MAIKIKSSYKEEVQTALQEMQEDVWEKIDAEMEEYFQGEPTYEVSFWEFSDKFCPECGSFLSKKKECDVCGFPHKTHQETDSELVEEYLLGEIS